MPTHVPAALAPYLQSYLQDGLTTLVTSVLDAPSYWLVLRTVRAGLFGVDDEVGTQTVIHDDGGSDGANPTVIFLNFLRSYDYWIELGKKTGLDIANLINKKRLVYIDGLTIGLDIPQPVAKVIKPKSHSLSDISHAITTAKSTLPQTLTPNKGITLIIDGLDFVLASQPDMSVAHLNWFITDVRAKFSSTVLTASADSPLLHNIEVSATPLEQQHSIFVRTTAHQSSWIIQLRPLETGHAKDVSGVVQIARGGAEVIDDEGLQDGEWLYQVKGDGSVRVWVRGE